MKATLVVAAIIVGCTSVPCLIASRWYWGYWIVLPSAAPIVSSIASVDRFTTFRCCSPSESGSKALYDASDITFHGAGDWPIAHLPAALVRRGFQPASTEAVPATLLARIGQELESRGVLIEGEAGSTMAKQLWGHVAIGQNAQGADIVIAALWGGEVSNDHHPYYEAAFARSPTGELSLLTARQYWFDFAGLEGIAHWLAAVPGFVVGVLWSAAYVFRRNRRAA